MAEIINLRIARKRADRERSQERAAAQRAAHGVSKAERRLAAATNEKNSRALDGHRIETGEVE